MADKVDVLAVMDEAAEALRTYARLTGADEDAAGLALEDAAVHVADLIAASDAVNTSLALGHCLPSEHSRLNATLATIGSPS